MQLGEATRDAEEEAAFATTSLFDARGMVMPTETAELQLESGVAILPHPAKAATGGEDASFSRDGCYGVFDGVGGWASKGVDSGAFSRQLATNAANVLDIIRSTTPYSPASVFEDLEMSLDAGLAEIEIKGSTTACMLFVSPDGRVGHFLNIGDSGFHIFRPAADGTRAMQLFAKSEIQQHEFNYPYQLSSWVANVAKRDLPKDGERYVHELQAGESSSSNITPWPVEGSTCNRVARERSRGEVLGEGSSGQALHLCSTSLLLGPGAVSFNLY